MSEFCKIPIDPEGNGDRSFSYLKKDYPMDTNAEMFCSRFNSMFFVFMWELAQRIHELMAWDKKARIVLEYDPEQKWMSVRGFMERGEAIQMANRRLHPDQEQ